MSLKQVSSNRNGIHNYEYKMKQVFSQIERELSPENVKLITKYNQAMTNLSIAIATRQKHLRTLLNLTKFVGKNWSDVTKDDIDELVFRIMDQYADDSGKESHYSYDHKKILKIFFRWLKLGSREFKEVGDPPETKHVKMRKVRDKIIREDLLTESDRTRLLHACGENLRDRAFIDCHFEGGTRPGEILNLQIKHVKFDKNGAILHVDGKTGPRTVRLVKSTPNLASWLSIHPMKDNPEAPLWVMVNKISFGQRMSYVAATSMIKRRAKSAHLSKKVHLNLFRHSEATESAKFMTEAQLRKRHGWSPDSSNLCENWAPDRIKLLLNLPSGPSKTVPLVMVCAAVSGLIQVTVSPF
ncbi:MAG: tyrosine-type recombinase/integrase [Nitrosarchaeum sp.]